MTWNKDCEDCRRRREVFIAAAKKLAEWIKNPIGARPDILNQTPIPSPRLPDPAPTSQEKVAGRIDPRGRVRE